MGLTTQQQQQIVIKEPASYVEPGIGIAGAIIAPIIAALIIRRYIKK